MPECKYDWPAAEKTFMEAPDVHPRVSLLDISRQYDIPYQTVRRYAAKHRWNSRRDNVYYEIRKARYPVKQPYVYIAGRGTSSSCWATYRPALKQSAAIFNDNIPEFPVKLWYFVECPKTLDA